MKQVKVIKLFIEITGSTTEDGMAQNNVSPNNIGVSETVTMDNLQRYDAEAGQLGVGAT